ncbi:MAG: glutamate--tRNA ligase [Candidatus Magasanikbacteria bacterium RIFCSPLOWO2_02_FULL_44_11]|uniref:Glutamate--tRNA ligase n=1 Tax=Candidatus Magasanikbacteria bacterium RIFCSPLOWO2_02_FULL_44_11 TaxID=1798689 RepID=A0A1F6NBM2_9BACT|nr:MAG: glutamate--tRNA ligase [Candidatus Magasanikbacteria bacterium RIFCSPLOWO2_02_FULL_44_11]
MIRTRFAPSPTGYLHVGGLRTALYSYLFAKKQKGKFLVRIEDTDRERLVADGTLNILQSLDWAGIVQDEGVCLAKDKNQIDQKGDRGPYIQSERLSIYRKYAEELLQKKAAYYCFCMPERLEELRDQQTKNKMPTGYDQHCLKTIPPEEAQKRVKAGERHVVRLAMPKIGETVFFDLIRGEVRIKNELVDDQILIKSDGFPTYHLAVVVDDHTMEISHVIRGEEWISSTPKHLQLYLNFGWKPPEFAHLPLLLNTDKSKLSKRQGDVAVVDYQKKGYLPEALVNFVAFLGWNPGGEQEIFGLDELIKAFSLEKVGKGGSVFNIEKLDWFNKEYLKRLDPAALLKRAWPWLVEAKLIDEKKLEDKKYSDWLARVLMLERERVTTLSELPAAIRFIFSVPDYPVEMLVWKKGTREEVKKVIPDLLAYLETLKDIDWHTKTLEDNIKTWIEANSFQVGSVLWPFRVALSGLEKSPGPFEIAAVLGKAEVVTRLKAAIHKVI